MPDRVTIQASEKEVRKIFCDDYAFVVPHYQRPYSWGVEEAGQLLDDLLFAAFQNGEKPYFLGSIVVVKKEGDPTAEVIDGQQRLTTLTILLSVLRELLPEGREALTRLIFEKGDDILGTQSRARLTLRSRDHDFFEDYVQHEGQISKLPQDAQLPDSQGNIRDNALHFQERLSAEFGDRIRYTKLAQYIAQNCYLVVVETSDHESAYRIFSVLNNRGLPLSITDILKAEVLGAIPAANEQARYTKTWEDTEENLGRESFEQLFSHIRMITMKAKARQSVLAEVRQHVQPVRAPIEFIEQTLEPYAAAYFVVKNSSFEARRKAEEVNRVLCWLNEFDNGDWVPPAILAVRKWGDRDADKLLHFLSRLERLAFTMFVLRANVNARIERYARVLSALEAEDADPGTRESGLGRTRSEMKDVIDILSGNIYFQKCVRYVLLRLTSTSLKATRSTITRSSRLNMFCPKLRALKASGQSSSRNRKERTSQTG